MARSATKRNKWSDHYSRQAKKDKFPARSVYKLREIQQKYHLIKKGNSVIDLGCSPGAWLLYAADLVGEKGLVTGIDIKPVSIKVPSHVRIYQGDLLTDTIHSLLTEKDYNVVLSDMAPSTTGNKTVDAARSFELCQAALTLAKDLLLPGGSFVCKIFQGEDFKSFSESVMACFNKHRVFKPQASRKGSKEIYIIGIGKN